MVELTDRFEDALVFAFRVHAKQRRKASDIPYISHLMGVAALVLEAGGDEDEAIAALLHDSVEDQGGLPMLEEIRSRFGMRVAMIVDGCSDSYGYPKPPWKERKEIYLQRLISQPPEVRRVSLADKLHNARNLLLLLQQEGHTIWERFNGGKEGTLWYFTRLNEIFKATGKDSLTDEYDHVVARIMELVNLQSGFHPLA